ncbi:tetratricopeptide repeat protein [Pseudomonas sp. BF-B-26]|uniref:tetratricopeptide repeat protein n=1 Tax=Pseudomonas sp. BF-B-26 TaxID=2832400 RepID=UPI001CBECCA8|nr:tetratricopeptide repeat protein [Pseudomonas sp. BF-B-26]
MDWDLLLDHLWAYASPDPHVLGTEIRSCLEGHSSEGLLEAISLLVTQGQNEAARRLLSEFLRNHQAADDIQRKLGQILSLRTRQTTGGLSTKSKQGGNEALLKDVNSLVASGQLDAAESLLQESIDRFEEPEDLVLLGRVYKLQGRATESAKAEQRGLMLKRQKQAFVETISAESIYDDLPTLSDLAFLDDSASLLAALDGSTASTGNTLTGTVKNSLNFIEQASSQYLPLTDHPSWEKPPQSASSEHAGCVDNSISGDGPNTPSDAAEGMPGDVVKKDEATTPATPKNVLKLARPRNTAEPSSGLTTVKMVNRSARLVRVSQPLESTSSEPVDASSLESTHTITPNVSPPKFQIPDYLEDDEDEDDCHESSGLDLATSIAPVSFELGESEDDYDIDHGLHGLSIIELETEYEPESLSAVDDFRDVDDDYAAYAFDPDVVFDGEDDEAYEEKDGYPDRLSREDRALQKAAELIGNANWPLSTLSLVQQIFVMSGWGATRLALEREIDKGLAPQELILASHIKVIWAENDIYWIAFDQTGSSRLSHQVLSWPTALLIVRSFELLPQVEELEVFLEGLFAAWYENNILRRAFRAFARYLWFRFSNLHGCLPANQHFDFCDPRSLPAEEYSDLGLCDVLEIEKTEILRSYGVFITKHPQEPSCYFSDKPPPAVEAPPLNAKKSKKKIEKTECLEDVESEGETSDDDDDCTAAKSLSASSAPVHALTIDQPTLRIELLGKGSAHEAP